MTKILQIDGLPVIDGKRALKLTVRPSDCRKANVKEPGSCAVARAAKRELHAKEVRVHLSRVYVRRGNKCWLRFLTPASMRAGIVSFDKRGEFEAGEYTLGAPHTTKRLGERRGGADTKSTRPPKSRRSPTVLWDVRGAPRP